MTALARLNRLTPALSGKQRALLVIHADLNGADPEKAWLDMPQDERREYDYYVALLYTSNHSLGLLCQMLDSMVGAVERDLGQHDLLGQAASLLEEELPEEVTEELVQSIQRDGRITVPEFLRRLHGEQRQKILNEVKQHWQELRALEEAWQDIAGECDGQDLRSPQLKEQAASVRERLLALAQQLGYRRRLPEPSADIVAMVQSHVDEAIRMMGYREPPE